jgi:hypothetical protein
VAGTGTDWTWRELYKDIDIVAGTGTDWTWRELYKDKIGIAHV